MLSGLSARAANLDIQPSLEEDGSWESNPLLLVHYDKPALFGSVTIPKITVTDKTPTTQFSGAAWVDEGIFNQPGFNSTDFHTNISLDQKLEQWEVGFKEQTDYDTTRTSELTPININTVDAVRHFGNSIAPVIAFSPSVADKISLAGSYAESKYDSDLFTDYHIFSVTPTYQHNFTPLEAGTLSVQAQRYQTDTGSQVTIDDIAPTIGWVSNLTPNLTATASVGAQATREDSILTPKEEWKWNAVYNADITYKAIEDSLSADALKSLQPYANGQEFYLNTFSLSETHTINALFTTNVSASYQFAGGSNDNATNLKTFINAGGGVSWHMTEKFDLNANYQYRDESFTNTSSNAHDNLFTLALNFHPQLENIKW